jgi:hypothetical protein
MCVSLLHDVARANASISLKDLTDTWQKQCTYVQEADVSAEEKQPARLRRVRVEYSGVYELGDIVHIVLDLVWGS